MDSPGAVPKLGSAPGSCVMQLAFSEQPENKYEDKYRRDDAATKFVSRSTGKAASQQVIHNNPPLVRKF